MNDFSGSYILVSGCSHTAGTGLDADEIWCSQLAEDLSCNLVNLALPSASAEHVSQSLMSYLSTNRPLPKLVIAQWPNPYRSMTIVDGKPRFYNVHSPDNEFSHRLRNDPESFWHRWIKDIIQINQSCKIPLINVCFETKDFVFDHLDDLESKNIELHTDEKIPGKTWHFDSMAKDRLHHSGECHRKWADRMLTIIKNTLQ